MVLQTRKKDNKWHNIWKSKLNLFFKMNTCTQNSTHKFKIQGYFHPFKKILRSLDAYHHISIEIYIHIHISICLPGEMIYTSLQRIQESWTKAGHFSPLLGVDHYLWNNIIHTIMFNTNIKFIPRLLKCTW